MPKIDAARLAIHNCQRRLHGISGDTERTGPRIERPARYIGNKALAARAHHAIENRVERAIAAKAQHYIISRARRLLCQFHRLATIHFEHNIGLPARRRKDGDDIRDLYYMLTRPQINYKTCPLAAHKRYTSCYSCEFL